MPALDCLGRFPFQPNAAIKKIGIRKINGARVSEIVFILTREFIIRVLMALVIAAPVAWYAMHNWLQSFAYKTELNGGFLLSPGSIAFGITFLTGLLAELAGSNPNPVDVLRYE
ncbi:MAG: hypothetical protein MZV63_42175 [Marinilabiliales bacterium]|nr:hypothetical protein [Marinilabiliales bacterium]